jgi:hypothetical protein
MKIKRSSLIYKFQDKAIVGDRSVDVPHNLCPYMRRFLRLVFTTFLLGCGVAGMIVVPFVAYFDLIVSLWLGLFVVFGAVGWGLLGFAACVALVLAIFTDNTRVGTQVLKGITYTREKIRGNIFVTWYRAVHDKICPELLFTGE